MVVAGMTVLAYTSGLSAQHNKTCLTSAECTLFNAMAEASSASSFCHCWDITRTEKSLPQRSIRRAVSEEVSNNQGDKEA